MSAAQKHAEADCPPLPTAERAAADIEGRSAAAKFGQPGRLSAKESAGRRGRSYLKKR